MVSPSQAFGQFAETLAENMLRKKGYQIIEKNLRLAGGELDLIAKKNSTLVFIEVKARHGHQFGGAPYAISPRKKRQIVKLALCYLSKHRFHQTQCRFDAILITGTGAESHEIIHIEEAFEVPSSDWQW